MTTKMNKITYFCCDSECNKEVAYYGAPCCLEHNPLVEEGIPDSLSHETSECPGCGMDIYVGANGYCSYCWVERFGCEEEKPMCLGCLDDLDDCKCNEAPPSTPTETLSPVEHKCSGEWDYDRGIRVCDFDDDPACPQYQPIQFEWKDRANCECKKSPMCKSCELYYGYADDAYDGDTHNCTNCKREFKNKYLRNQSLCRDCEDMPPLPPSPPNDLDEQIAVIEEKLRGIMTPGQTADWERLWYTAQSKKRALECPGCRDGVLNQQGHMVQGGCLDEPERIPWEDYDADDLRKMDLYSRH